MDVSDLVTEQKAKHAEFEVDDKSGIHLVAKAKGGKVLADVIVGKSTGPGTMVRPTGKDEVWQATGISRYMFDKSPADWRDKSITTFTAGDAEKIEVVAKDGAKTIVKKTGEQGRAREDGWEVVESSREDRQAGQRASRTASRPALSIWKANDFADGVKLADAGLEPPALTVTVDAQGRQEGDRADRQQEGRRRVLRQDARGAAGVRREEVQRGARAQAPDRVPRQDPLRHPRHRRHRDRGQPRRQLVHDRQERAPTGRRASRPSSRSTPARSSFASAFKEWKAQSFAEDATPKTNGLAKPQATIVAKGKGKTPTCTIKVGDETKDKLNYYVHGRQGHRRLPGAQVERRPRAGEARRHQEGRASSAGRRRPRPSRPKRPATKTVAGRHGPPALRRFYMSMITTPRLPPSRSFFSPSGSSSSSSGRARASSARRARGSPAAAVPAVGAPLLRGVVSVR